MRFTWDKRKCAVNLRKHGIDFAHAATIFRGFTLTAEDVREPYGEQRFLTLGMLDRQVVSIAHTETSEAIRIISIRKANRHETNYYFSQIPD